MRYEVELWTHEPSGKADVKVVVEAVGIEAAIQEAMRMAGLSYVHVAWVFPAATQWHGEGRFYVSRSLLARSGPVSRRR